MHVSTHLHKRTQRETLLKAMKITKAINTTTPSTPTKSPRPLHPTKERLVNTPTTHPYIHTVRITTHHHLTGAAVFVICVSSRQKKEETKVKGKHAHSLSLIHHEKHTHTITVFCFLCSSVGGLDFESHAYTHTHTHHPYRRSRFPPP